MNLHYLNMESEVSFFSFLILGGSFSPSTWSLKKKMSRTFSGASYSGDPSGYVEYKNMDAIDLVNIFMLEIGEFPCVNVFFG